jgi:hypothetical protein
VTPSAPAPAAHSTTWRSWRVFPSQVRAPTLLWHGDADRNATVAMARHLDGVIPDSTLHLHAGDGHLSIVTRHARSVLQALARRPPGARTDGGRISMTAARRPCSEIRCHGVFAGPGSTASSASATSPSTSAGSGCPCCR